MDMSRVLPHNARPLCSKNKGFPLYRRMISMMVFSPLLAHVSTVHQPLTPVLFVEPNLDSSLIKNFLEDSTESEPEFFFT